MRYEFGAYRIEAGERRLRRGQSPVALTPKAFDTLLVLVGSAGRAIGKDELLSKVWPDTNVAEATLAQNIFALRRTLGAACIETVPRFGYRFVPLVRQVRADGSPNILAVLPFENLSGDAGQDYFSDGLTEEMITQLGRLSPRQLGIIARTSVMQYKSTPRPVSDIARELGVSHVLTGSVRREGGRVRVTAQLIDARDQTHLWAGSYDRELVDILRLQSEVVQTIAEQIRLVLPAREQSRLDLAQRVMPEAYENYLRGRYLWNQRTRSAVEEAVRLFERAIAADPGSALPYAALGDCYVVLGSQLWIPPREAASKANAALAQAMALDDAMAEAHAALGFVRTQYEYRWSDAEQAFNRAIELNANYATAHHWLSFLLSALGRLDEALRAVHKAEALDPFSAIISTNVGTVLFWARRYAEAIVKYRSVLSRQPGFWIARWMLGLSLEQTGDIAGAVAAHREAMQASDGLSPVLPASLARALALSGEHAEAERLLAEARASASVSYLHLGAAYAALGRDDDAFRALFEGCERGESWMAFVTVDPRLDSLRADRRYAELRSVLRLPG